MWKLLSGKIDTIQSLIVLHVYIIVTCLLSCKCVCKIFGWLVWRYSFILGSMYKCLMEIYFTWSFLFFISYFMNNDFGFFLKQRYLHVWFVCFSLSTVKKNPTWMPHLKSFGGQRNSPWICQIIQQVWVLPLGETKIWSKLCKG